MHWLHVLVSMGNQSLTINLPDGCCYWGVTGSCGELHGNQVVEAVGAGASFVLCDPVYPHKTQQ